MQKKKEITDIIPEQDKNKETNTAKASIGGKLAEKKQGSTKKFKSFMNGKVAE